MTRQVASLYFAEVKADRDIFGGYYAMPAVPKGEKPFLLTVEDKVQVWQMSEGARRAVRRDLIAGEEIAADIVQQWTSGAVGMTGVCHPGIWIVRDVIPVLKPDGTTELDAMGRATFRPATEEEKATMWAEDLEAARIADANWAEWLIQQGDEMAEEPKLRPFIGPLRRAAARHYGRDRAWLHAMKDSDVKACPFCTSQIAVEAVKCPRCQEIVDFAKYAQLEKQRNAALKAAGVPVPVQAPVAQARA